MTHTRVTTHVNRRRRTRQRGDDETGNNQRLARWCTTRYYRSDTTGRVSAGNSQPGGPRPQGMNVHITVD